MKKFVLAFAATLFLASPAMAFHCPLDMKQIDAALETAQLDDATLAKVKELRAMGEEQHKAGNHAESVETLGEAKALLGIE